MNNKRSELLNRYDVSSAVAFITQRHITQYFCGYQQGKAYAWINLGLFPLFSSTK